MRIVLFGDSLFGQFGKEQILKLEQAVPDSDVYNCAAGGWDTNDGLKKASFIARLEPDIVVLGFGTNDAAPWKQVPLEEYLDNISKIIEKFAGSKVIFFLPPPVHPDNGHSAEYRRFPETVQEYHDEAKKALQDMNIPYVDSQAVFTPLLQSGQRYHVEDGVHLNDFGYDVLIKEFARLIKAVSTALPPND